VYDGLDMKLAREMNEWCGTKGTCYRYEVRLYTHGEVVIKGMDSTCDTNEVLFCEIDVGL